MNKKYLISAALMDELNPVLQAVEILKEKEILNTQVWEAKFGDKELVIYKTGVSRTNAAFATTVIIHEYQDYDLTLINLGSSGAGTINEKVFSTVIANKLFYREPDVIGYKKGQVPYEPEFFSGDKHLIDVCKKIFSNREDIIFGNYVCSEAFMEDKKIHEDTANLFEDIKSIDMESTAVAHIANKLNIPFLGIRTISDNIFNDESPIDQFEKAIKSVGFRYTEVLKEVLTNV